MKHLHRFLAPTLITIISYLVSDQRFGLYDILRYNREAILNGEFWRILTGNLTHAGTGHWLVNIFGLWLLWIIYVTTRKLQYKMLLAILATSSGTCIGLFLFEPQLKFYVGLSGALHGFFAAGIVFLFRREPKLQVLLAFLLCTKLVYEQIFGALPGSEKMTTIPVIVNSHLYGALTGLIFGLMVNGLKLKKNVP